MNAISRIFTIAILLFIYSCGTQKKHQKPNIIIILADDLGYDDLGIRNKDLMTPNLDRFARVAVSFRQFYVNPVCAPSRASLLTGRDFIRTGVSHVHGGKDFIHLGETLLPEAMRLNGYATGMWGKWHSGHSTGYFPWERGFDEAYMADLYKHQNSTGLFDGREVKHKKWSDEVIVDYAIQFIAKNKEKPFFAFLPSLSPHGPVSAPEHLIAQYEQKGFSKNVSSLYAMITQMDQQLGRLFDYLETSGLDENTVIIFLSDNGPQISTGFLTPEERNKRYISRLKGHKGNIWENGVKSPFLIKWGKKYTNGVRDQLADITDLYPTLVALAGGKYPENQLPLDGQSLLPVLENESINLAKSHFNWAHFGWAPVDKKPYSLDGQPNEYTPINREAINWEDQIMSLRKQQYKLLLNPQYVDGMGENIAQWLLFDILNDPSENVDLSKKNTDLFEGMKAELLARFAEASKEPHAFHPPIFQIDSTQPESRVWTKAPIDFTQGMLNSALELKYWNSGSWANYLINVEKAGYYSAMAVIQGINCPISEGIMTIDDQSFSLPVNMDQSAKPIWLAAGEKSIQVRFKTDSTQPCDTLFSSFKHIVFKYVSN